MILELPMTPLRTGTCPFHLCTGTGLTPTTSAAGLGSPLPYLHGDSPHLPPQVPPLCYDFTAVNTWLNDKVNIAALGAKKASWTSCNREAWAASQHAACDDHDTADSDATRNA